MTSALTKMIALGAMFTLLAGSFLRSRRRQTYPTAHTSPHVWHPCYIADCNTLVRPAEILCGPHMQLVPVPLRMKLASSCGPEWVALSRRAIGAVLEAELLSLEYKYMTLDVES